MHLTDLFEHLFWAHDALLAELHARAPDAETMRLFAHVVAAEHLWLSRIDGVAPEVAVWPSLGIGDAAALEARNRRRFRQLLERPDDALGRRVAYRNSLGHDFSNTVDEILTHVALHGHYHRGQIARAMRAAGREPVYTDFIGWLRRGR